MQKLPTPRTLKHQLQTGIPLRQVRKIAQPRRVHHPQGLHRQVETILHQLRTAWTPSFIQRMSLLQHHIKKLHKHKSFLITLLNRYYKDPRRTSQIIDLATIKYLINTTNKLLKEEYSKTQTNHWSHVYKSIDYKKPQSFFPQIKRLFRPQNSPAINFLTINQQNAHLCPRINMPSSDADTVQHIYEPKSILNFIGTYYETINSPRFTNQNTPLKKEVDAHIHALMTEFENDTLENTSITTFSDNNPAHSPTTPANNFLFSDFRTTYSIFKSLPNKTSTGLDNIPPIVLKHLPLKIIDDYNKIFNNCINNRQNAQSYRHPIEKKAQTAFRALSNLFHNKYLNHKAKIICYLLLIRPIITYASPIWWNCSASTMEKIRKFERVCLRSSLHMYRRYDSVNKPYFSTNALYNRAGIPHIDNHIIKLTRDYMANLASINNNYMSEFASFVRSSAINTAATGYISPHSFISVLYSARGSSSGLLKKLLARMHGSLAALYVYIFILNRSVYIQYKGISCCTRERERGKEAHLVCIDEFATTGERDIRTAHTRAADASQWRISMRAYIRRLGIELGGRKRARTCTTIKRVPIDRCRAPKYPSIGQRRLFVDAHHAAVPNVYIYAPHTAMMERRANSLSRWTK
ncbi:unnamed protein product, partial [Trichogramma brassicae]